MKARTDLYIGYILAILFDSFPNRQSLNLNELRSKLNSIEGENEEFVVDLSEWLHAENYIRYSTIIPNTKSDPILINATITEKSLSVLKKIPSSLVPNSTIGEVIVSGAKDIGSEVAKSQISGAIGELLGGFAKGFIGN